MTAKSSSLRDKIAQLHRAFVSQLPERLHAATETMAALRRTPGAMPPRHELHRLFHSIKGTSASFKLTELATLAREGEQWLIPLLDSSEPVDPPVLDGLERILGELDRAASRLLYAEAHGEAISLTGFTLPESFTRGGAVPHHRPRVIYLCDDDPGQVEPLAMQLRCFGYDTRVFATTAALRQAITEKQPDALILDIVFPEGEEAGIEILTGIRREMTLDAPVIFLSARQEFAMRLKAVQAGGAAYFPKPVKAIEVAESLDALTMANEPLPFRILVVDDEPEVSRLHGIILEQAGMETSLLHDPGQVLTVLREFNPDLVLMDMYMPLCNGLDLARVIRQIPDYIGLPIIYLSGETNSWKQFTALRVGADGFLTKPIRPQDLVSAVLVRAERMRILRSLMVRDSLTGLYNHTTIKQHLDLTLARAERHGGSLCFAMIDVDRFKTVNDTHGHMAGDQVLVALSRILQKRLRHSDLVGRYGGEEFAVVMPDLTQEQGVRILDQLREDFGKVRFFAKDKEFTVTFSSGVACYPGYASADQVCEAADQALYAAKNAGRNRVIAAACGGAGHG